MISLEIREGVHGDEDDTEHEVHCHIQDGLQSWTANQNMTCTHYERIFIFFN